MIDFQSNNRVYLFEEFFIIIFILVFDNTEI